MVTYNNSTNDYATSRIIVSQNPGQGNFTTIQSAITAASPGAVVFILPGTYTENLTLKGGVNLECFTAIGEYGNPNVTIVGKMIDNGVGLDCSFSNISFQTNGDYVLQLTGNGSSIQFIDCNIDALNNAALSMNGGTQNIFMYQCVGGIGNAGIGFYNITAGDLWLHECQLTNSGSSTTNPTFSAGAVSMYDSQIGFPLGCSGTGVYALQNCVIDTASLNTTCVTTAGTGTSTIRYTSLASGTAPAIIIGAGTTVNMDYLTINSSNAQQISQ